MISRRVIRIKVMQTLYSLHCSDDKSINLAEKELFFSIQKTYDLYHLMLQLLVDMKGFASTRIEQNLAKHRPTVEDLNPNKKFVENVIISKIEENTNLEKYIQTNKLSWINNPELIRKLYTELNDADTFKRYMTNEARSEKEDLDLVDFIYTEIIATSEDLAQILEEQSIYWTDDLEFVISMILKTIRKFKSTTSPNKALMPLFKEEDDLDFTKKLFRKSVLDQKENQAIIENHLKNWDLERIAFIDLLIMQLAITEFLNFPSVPTKVTLNEYIDLARFYSTSKSRTFINGILDKILKDLKNQGKIIKAGRGLIGEDGE